MFASAGKQVANAVDLADCPGERQVYPQKLSLNPKIFSVATEVVLKCWAVCDQQVSGMRLLEKNMPDTCSLHTSLFLQTWQSHTCSGTAIYYVVRDC